MVCLIKLNCKQPKRFCGRRPVTFAFALARRIDRTAGMDGLQPSFGNPRFQRRVSVEHSRTGVRNNKADRQKNSAFRVEKDRCAVS